MISNLLLLLAFRSPNMPPLYSLKRKYRRSAAFRRSYFANWLDAKIKPFSINVAEELRQRPGYESLLGGWQPTPGQPISTLATRLPLERRWPPVGGRSRARIPQAEPSGLPSGRAALIFRSYLINTVAI